MRSARRGGTVGAAFLLGAFALAARWALADDAEPPLAIEWTAPEACPDRAHVEARTFELLGGAPKSGAPRLVARGTIAKRADDKFALTLELDRSGHASTRKLESSSCATLSETGALVIALAFDPDAVQATSSHPTPSATPSASSASPVPSASAPPTSSPSASASAAPPLPPSSAPPLPPGSAAPTIPWTPPPPVVDASRSVKLGFGVGVDFLADYGSLPDFSPGFRARVGLTIDAYRIEPLFEAWPSATATLARSTSVGADFAFFAGGLRLCRRVLPWSSRARSIAWLTGCIDGEIGEISATGFGVDKALTATALWGAAGAEIEGRLGPPGPIGIVATLGFVVPFDPRPFVVETPARDEVFASAPISLRLGAGLDARF